MGFIFGVHLHHEFCDPTPFGLPQMANECSPGCTYGMAFQHNLQAQVACRGNNPILPAMVVRATRPATMTVTATACTVALAAQGREGQGGTVSKGSCVQNIWRKLLRLQISQQQWQQWGFRKVAFVAWLCMLRQPGPFKRRDEKIFFRMHFPPHFLLRFLHVSAHKCTTVLYCHVGP